jgi:hypothetical protein
MNEKIRELAKQAGQGKPFHIPPQFVAKFAELIAKEILNISDEVINLSDSPEWLICERLGINHDWRRQDNFWS